MVLRQSPVSASPKIIYTALVSKARGCCKEITEGNMLPFRTVMSYLIEFLKNFLTCGT